MSKEQLSPAVKKFIEKHITCIENKDYQRLYQEMSVMPIGEQEQISKIFLQARIIPDVSENEEFNIVHFWAKHADADPYQFVLEGLGTSYINVVYAEVLDELSLLGLFDDYDEESAYDVRSFRLDEAEVSWSAREESQMIYDAAAYSNSPKQFKDTIYKYLESKASQLSN